MDFQSLMNAPVRIVVSLGVVIAICAGVYWLGHERGLADGLALKGSANDLLQENNRLRDENVQLTADNDRLKKQQATPEPSQAAQDAATLSAPGSPNYLDRLHILADLKDEGLANVAVQVINKGNGKLQARFVELFNVSPAEKTVLDQAIEDARQQTEQLFAANAKVSRRADGAVVISINPTDEGNAIQGTLMNAFAQTLGPDRNAAFLALQGNGAIRLGSAMGEFGTQPRTITLSHASSPDGTKPTISVLDEQQIPGGSGTTSSTSVPNPASIPANLRWALPLLPADF